MSDGTRAEGDIPTILGLLDLLDAILSGSASFTLQRSDELVSRLASITRL
jgi:hypothetical protein